MTRLQRIASPALPFAAASYSSVYMDQLLKILRLYFSQLDSNLNQLSAPQVYTVATLPSAITEGVGSIAFVTNALAPTFGATVVGGGSVAAPVYSDGTNWKVG